MPLSEEPNKNVDSRAGSRQSRLTIATDENPSSGHVPQAQTHENVSATSAGATGASVELPIPSIDLTETPPHTLRFGRRSGNDEMPIIDLTQTPQSDDVMFVSETNEVSFVSGQASNNNVQRATRRRLALDSPAQFMCPICLESVVEREPTSTMCGHVFCKSCIRQALTFNRRCPICKAEVELDELLRLHL
uniref:RING-type domain-containing protein n=1 Tax=Glossina morsitans morsitans TaxID=37546 RepID=A0A1B0G8C1_GLOMM